MIAKMVNYLYPPNSLRGFYTRFNAHNRSTNRETLKLQGCSFSRFRLFREIFTPLAQFRPLVL